MSQSFFLLPALLCGVIFVNGWTDAPNTIAGVVTGGALSFPRAVFLAAAGNLAGVASIAVFPAHVTESIFLLAGFSAQQPGTSAALAAALGSVVFWAVFAWLLGIPTSESHALLAGLAGASAALGHSHPFFGWGLIWGGLLFSAALGFLAGRLAGILLIRHPLSLSRMHVLQRLGAAGSAFLHGTQDGQKFWGLFLLLGQVSSLPRGISPDRCLWLCAALMSAGTLLGGRRIIDTIAGKMVQLPPAGSFAADCGGIASLALATVLGLPVSTTHARTCSLLGAGTACGASVRPESVLAVFGAWFLTFPACTALSYLLTRLLLA